MGILKRKWIWLKRFRHRRGYGVHSPFAFNFITYVIYERGEYYAFRDLRQRHRCMAYYWGGHSVKCRKFLFRLSNYVHPSVVRLYGEVGEVWKDYITNGCPSAQLYVEDIHNVTQKNDSKRDVKELIVVNEDVPCELWKKIIAQIISDDSVCIISGIHKSKQVLAMWNLIKEDFKVVISFDLYDFGILFFDTSKQRQHYIVNFN